MPDEAQAFGLDSLPPPLAQPALRFAAEHGVKPTVTILQNLFAVEATGAMNSETLAAINGFAAGSDIQRAVKAFALACAEFLNPTPSPDQE